MTQSFDEQLTKLFDRAEIELPGEDFGAQVMGKVEKHRRRTAVWRYGSWVLVLLCLCSVFPVAVEVSLYLGNIIGNSPFLLWNSLQSYLGSPMVLIMLSASAGYLLIKFRLLRLPSLYLFGRIRIYRIF